MFEFKGKGLFVFSDPGAGKAVLAQVLALKDLLIEYKIISDREYSFFKDFDLQVLQNTNSAEDVIRKIKPDFVFTGTSYTSQIELKYILAAKKENIKTYSFIDHWTSLKERFNFSGKYIFPDHILVIDERAKSLATESGIDNSLVKIFGNPYYLYLEKWRPEITKTELLAMLHSKKINSPIIVFAPDPLSNVATSLNYGFDEISATKNISNMLDGDAFESNFVLKLHPNQNKNKILPVIGDKIIIAEAGLDSNLLLFHADLVIGFFSNFLIEASIMKKKILRYLPNNISTDPLSDVNIGKIVNSSELLTELKLLNGIK
ncbi:MAG TPA: hypothetical protein VNZ49_12085 [Bacteroidia bacterium]|jgi:hypothetical protein|nr:hypothetical protein [Bacteroidia bacterium]